MKQPAIQIPEGCSEVLLHACCAPCSSAIVEWLLGHGVRPTIFYYNPNIWPREEYEIRKEESKRHAASLGIRWIDGDYDHDQWRQGMCGLEGEPERGRRCEQCFALRLREAAKMAKQLGLKHFTTTLASSRWKSLEQIGRAGHLAEQSVAGTCFWAQNWRKGGLYERRNQLLKAYEFYNQQYCGCEFSAGGTRRKEASDSSGTKEELRQQMREAKRQHSKHLAEMSEVIVDRLRKRLMDADCVMAYWPLRDEVDIRPLIDELAAKGRTVLLPKITGEGKMKLSQYQSRDDLKEGPFHVLEPSGKTYPTGNPSLPTADAYQEGIALVPGLAFDAAGHRLGRGKGYYDRFLSAHPQWRRIGIGFPFQRVAQVPVDEHDIKMDEII